MVLHYIKKRRRHKKRAANDELSKTEDKVDESSKLATNPYLFFNKRSLDIAQNNQGLECLVDSASLDYVVLHQGYN